MHFSSGEVNYQYHNDIASQCGDTIALAYGD